MKKFILKLTLFLISKQPEVVSYILKPYFDKTVISVTVENLNETINCKDVILFNSTINHSYIKANTIQMEYASSLTQNMITISEGENND